MKMPPTKSASVFHAKSLLVQKKRSPFFRKAVIASTVMENVRSALTSVLRQLACNPLDSRDMASSPAGILCTGQKRWF